MKSITLKNLLSLVKVKIPQDFVNPEIKHISFNSKDVKKGGLFLGLPGTKVDGGKFWKDAIKNGAEAAIISEDAAKLHGKFDANKVLVLKKPLEDLYGQIVSHFYDYPSRKVKLIGVTGTNGKTTVTFLLEYLLEKLGKKVALFGTLINRWPGYSETSNLTTDFADKLQPKLYAAKEANAEFVIMEVSSHSIAQKRISGCEFFASVFTNLSQDHLDYHKNMQSYFDTKMELFNAPYLDSDNGFSIINYDNEWGCKLLDKVNTKAIVTSLEENIKRFKNKKELFFITNKIYSGEGTSCVLHSPTENIQFFTPLVGEFNLMNSIQAIAVLYEIGFPLKDICKAIESFPGVPGRMEIIKVDEDKNKFLPKVIIDYAHTPDGLNKVLKSIKRIKEGRIILVFGCGGDRDSKKRPLMGSIAESFTDYIIITSDNPRTENPQKIIEDIIQGIKNRRKINFYIDRSVAIRKAINYAKSNDVILIAGKGHENYQIFKDKVIDFDDKKIATEFLIKKLRKHLLD
tara:strand:+ start:728 stop:2272 length:1545 start_codon:yes stop_codon:yes gene_type:complete